MGNLICLINDTLKIGCMWKAMEAHLMGQNGRERQNYCVNSDSFPDVYCPWQ